MYPTALVSMAGDLFSETITAYDETYTLPAETPGRFANFKFPNRKISGVIQTKDNKKVAIDPDGQISDGTLLLHTREVLFTAAYDVQQRVQEPTVHAVRTDKQTYVLYGDEIWRVSELSDWTAKAGGYNVYVLTKFTNIGGLEQQY